MQNNFKSYRICQIAVSLFTEVGFDETSMIDIAEKAAIPEVELYSYFGHKNDIILFFFQSINSDWQIAVDNISSKKIANRFEEALMLKVKLITPYVGFLNQILGLLIQSSKIGVKASRTSHIRAIGMQTMQSIIDGSTNGKKTQKKVPQLPSMMYFAHWAVLFTHMQTEDNEKVTTLIKLLSKSLKHSKNFALIKKLFPVFDELGKITEDLLNVNTKSKHTLDKEILKVIFNNRKATNLEKQCELNQCPTCFEVHEHAVNFFTSQNKPIHFILPAFPAKSPNRSKTIGKTPDLGEEIALKTLASMCAEIESIYDPGAQITICSDGRIFSELVGVSDHDVTEYVQAVSDMIAQHGIKNINVLNLEDFCEGEDFEEMRKDLLTEYAEDIENLKSKIKTKPDALSLFNGMHRFITEDRLGIDKDKSKTRVKEESKLIAIKVIQHSNAWTRFLANVYPEAIRLSIHPYPAHHKKIGIQLTKAEDNWLTPWHGVITLQKNDYLLMKKSKAEEIGATLIYNNDIPYYYSLNED